MFSSKRYQKILSKYKFQTSNFHSISKYLHKDKTSKSIRQKFLDYFIKDNGHHFVRSSPVIPYCDPTVAFVNAGMNQFKGVLLGYQSPLYNKVSNSQKCIRIGGKHNDLNVIGTDGYHHTFFEMLGSWSFGAYYKKEACELAWNLLTKVYKINKNSLYFTYFNGNPELNLPADLECKEIWRSLGIKEDRIIGFGMKDNFWEMGLVGPCGPCTEIHVDLRGPTNRAKFINKGLHDLIEIWNVVFIQYKRNGDGTVEKMPKINIDTGMGFERLCALLQRKTSNYDTDLFTPIFNAMKKICKDVQPYNGAFGEKDWNNLQSNYRVLVDHTRMLTVCLADGMIPETNQKLRRIMRRAFLISDTIFKQESGLVKELSNYVVDSLADAYPELDKNIQLVHQIIDYEEDLYKHLRFSSSSEWQTIIKSDPNLANLDIMEMPGLLAAYKNLKTNNVNEISSQYVFKLYDTFGLDEETIIKLADGLRIPLNVKDIKGAIESFKTRSSDVKNNNVELSKKLDNLQLPPTNDAYKYKYEKTNNNYIFNGVESKVLSIIKNGELINAIEPNEDCWVIFDRTPLYFENGGQCSDMGYAVYNDGIFQVSELENLNGRILHKGNFKSTRKLAVGETLKINVDPDRRLKHMRNHTATHLLNSAVRKLKGATCQKSSKIVDESLTLDVGIFGEKLSVEDVKVIERQISDMINEGVAVKVSEIDSQQLLSHDDVTLIPGEKYPENGIRLIEVVGKNLISREPCCGTHVLNTADILDFCIINCKSLGRSTVSIQAVTGNDAKVAKSNGAQIIKQIDILKSTINHEKPELIDSNLKKIKQSLHTSSVEENAIPYVVKQFALSELDEANRMLKTAARNTFKNLLGTEIKNDLEERTFKSRTEKQFIVHFLKSSTTLEPVPLQKVTKLCPTTPVLIISYDDSMVKARCCVPENMRSDDFNAQKWVETISGVFKSTAKPSRGQNPELVCNMKAKYVNVQEWETLLKESLNIAIEYAKENL